MDSGSFKTLDSGSFVTVDSGSFVTLDYGSFVTLDSGLFVTLDSGAFVTTLVQETVAGLNMPRVAKAVTQAISNNKEEQVGPFSLTCFPVPFGHHFVLSSPL